MANHDEPPRHDGGVAPRWFGIPAGERVELRLQPRPTSWNQAQDADQLRLREYLDDTVALLDHQPLDAPWALSLNVGLPDGQDLLAAADLDNYALPLARRLQDEDLVSVWCRKRHGSASCIVTSPAAAVDPPSRTWRVPTTASDDSRAYKEQVRHGVGTAKELPEGPVTLQVSFVVGPRRSWLNLWKPTIDALEPLLGRAPNQREWNPRDGRITLLGLHAAVDPALGNDVHMEIAAEPTA